MLFANLPEAASWLLGFLLGVELIAVGGAPRACSPGGCATVRGYEPPGRLGDRASQPIDAGERRGSTA